MKFPYQKEKSRIFGEIYRPVVKFEIKTKLGWIPILAYIDSGADVTLLPMSFVKALKIKIVEEEIKEIRGIGEGKISVIIKEVEMKLCNKIIKTKVTIDLIEDVPYLLGREDIFDHFEICFKQKNKTTCFKPEE